MESILYYYINNAHTTFLRSVCILFTNINRIMHIKRFVYILLEISIIFIKQTSSNSIKMRYVTRCIGYILHNTNQFFFRISFSQNMKLVTNILDILNTTTYTISTPKNIVIREHRVRFILLRFLLFQMT